MHFECKSSIHQIINVNEKRFLGVEYRIHWFEFEDPQLFNANGIEINNTYPIEIDINTYTNDLCIATKSDVRMINLKNGQTKRIIATMIKNNENQDTCDIT
jgi:hypothetical protein